MIWERSPYRITDDPKAVDLAVIHEFLTTSHWVRGISHSVSFSLLLNDRQVGFARAVTDRATFACLADVFIVEDQRGRGLGGWLVATVRAHPDLAGLRRWLLATRDAQALYRKFGFTGVADPSTLLTRHDPDIYTR